MRFKIVATGDDDDSIDVAQQNEIAVVEFCEGAFDDLDDDLVAFLRQPGGELTDRGLRNAELLAQAYSDLSEDLGGELVAEVSQQGQALLERAADIRRAEPDSAAVDPVALETLIADVATAIEGLPGSERCATAPLKGDG